jgi:hypothetical protein
MGLKVSGNKIQHPQPIPIPAFPLKGKEKITPLARLRERDRGRGENLSFRDGTRMTWMPANNA